MAIQLPPLPYEPGALEPVNSAGTLQFHMASTMLPASRTKTVSPKARVTPTSRSRSNRDQSAMELSHDHLLLLSEDDKRLSPGQPRGTGTKTLTSPRCTSSAAVPFNFPSVRRRAFALVTGVPSTASTMSPR
jgi:hypothetical protein